MVDTADVVIVGGGVMGSAVATFLGRDPGFGGSVVVIERDPAYRRASSALSASSIRQQFSTPENIRMSRFGFGFLRDVAAELAVDGPGEPEPDIGLVERGYLYLATEASEGVLRANHEVQVAEGADVVLLTPAELALRFPWLDVSGLVLGSFGRSGEGWFDGYGLTRAFRRKAAALGAAYRTGEVVGFDLRQPGGDRIESIRLADGSRIVAGDVVDAAGPWAASVAAMAGVGLPVEARRRTVFVFTPRDPVPGCPLVIDPSGAWFRPDGETMIGAIAPTPDRDQPDLPLEMDRGQWEAVLWPILAGRVPAFDSVRLGGGWAGYYEMNTHDHNAILGRHPTIRNLIFANGFSGHGIQQSPAVGRAIAELISHGRYISLDLSAFGYERIAAGRRIEERNVIG